MKILIVEDNRNNLKLFRIIVESLGHQCHTAADGEEGVAAAVKLMPDLILMDIQMPKMDGITAMGQLRRDEHTRNIPVVALTSYAMKGDRERFLAEGFDDYMDKPISKDLFVELIEKYALPEQTAPGASTGRDS